MIVARNVVLTLFAGGRYSVIRGYTQASLLLFDSGGHWWVSRDCIDVSGTDVTARHRLASPSTLALKRSF